MGTRAAASVFCLYGPSNLMAGEGTYTDYSYKYKKVKTSSKYTNL